MSLVSTLGDHAYPPDLAAYVETHWPPGRTLSLSRELLSEALSVAFQASLTTEEARPTRFRLLLMRADRLPEAGVANQGVLRLMFDHTPPADRRRAAPPEPVGAVRVGAHRRAPRRRRAAHLGHRALRAGLAGADLGRPQRRADLDRRPDRSRHRSGPAGRALRRQAGRRDPARRAGRRDDGRVRFRLAAGDVRARARAGARRARRAAGAHVVAHVRRSLADRAHRPAHAPARDPAGARRRQRRDDPVSSTTTRVRRAGSALAGLRLKFRFDQDEPSQRYRTLLFQILERVAAATSKSSVGWSDFALDASPGLERLEQSVFELSRLIANLAAIDGAVVRRQAVRAGRLRRRGLGGAVVAVARVARARHRGRTSARSTTSRTSARATAPPIASCTITRSGLAIVISHDGGVSFVANRGGEVVFWEQSVSP